MQGHFRRFQHCPLNVHAYADVDRRVFSLYIGDFLHFCRLLFPVLFLTLKTHTARVMKKTGNNLIPLQDICGVALLYYIGCLMISVGVFQKCFTSNQMKSISGRAFDADKETLDSTFGTCKFLFSIMIFWQKNWQSSITVFRILI